MAERIVYVGNFGPEHSTESHLYRALTANGHDVHRIQEGPTGYGRAAKMARHGRAAFVLWTHTAGLGPPVTYGYQRAMLRELGRAGIPTVGYHLDRWHGLDREHLVHESPFFRCDVVCTADGGAEWPEHVNHYWFPPGVLGAECGLGTPRDEYRADVAFVGSWRPGYHPEWPHRADLVKWLDERYGTQVRFFPPAGAHAIRGRDLADLYASVKVVVGDSCLAPYSDGRPASFYCSDRIPETLGRGGCLVHPRVEGIIGYHEQTPWVEQTHLEAWDPYDWDELAAVVDLLLADPIRRVALREQGRDHTLAFHTYETRMVGLVNLLRSLGYLAREATG